MLSLVINSVDLRQLQFSGRIDKSNKSIEFFPENKRKMLMGNDHLLNVSLPKTLLRVSRMKDSHCGYLPTLYNIFPHKRT